MAREEGTWSTPEMCCKGQERDRCNWREGGIQDGFWVGRQSGLMATGTGEGDRTMGWPRRAVLKGWDLGGAGRGSLSKSDGLPWSDQVPWKLLELPAN